jgi:hypothetical protein
MRNYEDITSVLIQTAAVQDSVIVIHRAYVRFTGNLESAMMLGQLLYWTPRSTNDGWIARSDKEFSDELFITVYAVRAAREHLEKMGVIETNVKKFDGTPMLHYRIHREGLGEAWLAFNSKPDSLETKSPLCADAESLTETTTKTTTDTLVVEKPIFEMPPQLQLKTPRTPDDIRRMTTEALFSGIAKNAERVTRGEFDTTHFPADVQDILGSFCRLWSMEPPAVGSGRFSWWVKGARALLDACAEFKEELLTELREELKGSELTISSPSSLVNMAAALAGKKRQANAVAEKQKDESYYWNSELSEAENLRRMQEKRKPQNQ